MNSLSSLRNKKIILGVTGCIAAYKAAEITRKLKKLGADVWVVMTTSAQKFITPLTMRTLSGNPCITEMFSDEISSMPLPHISLSESADLILIVPATANILGKAANGIADDILSTTLLSCECPVIFAPAMNDRMWKNAVVKENVKKLKVLGHTFIGPEKGELACGTVGEGHIAETDDILKSVVDLIGIKQDLVGKKVLITAGGTKEAIDPVRFIGNRSSGKMGYALAQDAHDRGANVTLISAASLEPPKGVFTEFVKTAKDMKICVEKYFKDNDILIMAAAVSDFTPSKPFSNKIKKGAQKISFEMESTEDILSSLPKSKNKIIVGFSLESEDLLKNSKKKLSEKNLDMIVANDISAFESDRSKLCIISKNGKTQELPVMDKTRSSQIIIDNILKLQQSL